MAQDLELSRPSKKSRSMSSRTQVRQKGVCVMKGGGREPVHVDRQAHSSAAPATGEPERKEPPQAIGRKLSVRWGREAREAPGHTMLVATTLKP